MRAPWLGDVLRDAGLTVRAYGNPVGRGADMRAIVGVVNHDTVTTRAWTDESVRRLLRDGRPGVPGPLAQLGLNRDGVFDWIADGRCNHNGYGRWGNDCIGIEVYCAGGLPGHIEPYNRVQTENVARANAAILRHLAKSEAYAQGHKEQDPRRKVDPFGVSMDYIRQRTRVHLGVPDPAPAEEEHIVYELINFPGGPTVGLVNHCQGWYAAVPNVAALKYIGKALDLDIDKRRTISSAFLRSLGMEEKPVPALWKSL